MAPRSLPWSAFHERLNLEQFISVPDRLREHRLRPRGQALEAEASAGLDVRHGKPLFSIFPKRLTS